MVVITADAHQILIDTLRKHYEVLVVPAITYDQLSEIISEVEGLVVTTRLSIDRPLLEKAVKLKWIGRLGSGMELIDTEFTESNNIKCISSPEGNRNAVAEHALGMILSLLNNISYSAAQVKEGIWERNENRGIELSGKTIGIIGYGNTGESFSKLLQPFDVTVLANDKYKSGFANTYVKESSLEEIYEQADIISFHVPLTTETQNMADEFFFGRLKRSPFIINTARGKIVDLEDLREALTNGKISGACLDVLPNESLETYDVKALETLKRLLSDKRILITPHIAGYSNEAYYKMSVVLLKKLGISI